VSELGKQGSRGAGDQGMGAPANRRNDALPKGWVETPFNEIAELKPLKVVFRDDCFKDDKDRINVEGRFKRLSPESSVEKIIYRKYHSSVFHFLLLIWESVIHKVYILKGSLFPFVSLNKQSWCHFQKALLR